MRGMGQDQRYCCQRLCWQQNCGQRFCGGLGFTRRMTLNERSAQLRRQIFDDLLAGKPPRTGAWDEERRQAALRLGRPQMGSVTYKPWEIQMEFVFSDAQGSALILTVTEKSEERIVYMPVPDWVVETIWQGDISGSYHFESEAMRRLEALRESLSDEKNIAHFEPKAPTRRE